MILSVIHKTDYLNAISILRNGFDLNKFGNSTKKTGQSFNKHPRAIYFSKDEGHRPEDSLSHPYDHKDRGVLIFCTVRLNNPLILNSIRIEGEFYQDFLANKYNATGGRLSNLMKKEGYDGIVCLETGEVAVFDVDNIDIDEQKSSLSLNAYLNWRKSSKINSFKEWLWDHIHG
jgi:hypothetical protein